MTKKKEVKKPTPKPKKEKVDYKAAYSRLLDHAHKSDLYAAKTIHDLLDEILELFNMIDAATPTEGSLLKMVANKKREHYEVMHEMVIALLDKIDDSDEED